MSRMPATDMCISFERQKGRRKLPHNSTTSEYSQFRSCVFSFIYFIYHTDIMFCVMEHVNMFGIQKMENRHRQEHRGVTHVRVTVKLCGCVFRTAFGCVQTDRHWFTFFDPLFRWARCVYIFADIVQSKTQHTI